MIMVIAVYGTMLFGAWLIFEGLKGGIKWKKKI